jgi:glutathione synthase/RimK-type ligase-like ATP-grasp enzyme
MSRLVIVVEKATDWGSYFPSENVVAAQDYLKEAISVDDERVQVINLCRSYKYLGVGYYVSLLAEARGHKVIPSVRTINDLRKRALYGLDIEDLNQKLTNFLPAGGRDTTDLGVLVYFGETSYAALADLARQVFETFPCPILRLEFEREKVWQISAIKPASLHTLAEPQEDSFAAALDKFSKKLWRKPRARRQYRYDIAMLADPNEQMPPSNKRALKLFAEAGRELAIEVETIGKNDYSSLAEYDGLFIRETTALDSHTYRFANKAEKEGMVVIDDPGSILKCTNKIYLHDLLKSRKLPTPKTEILYRDDGKRLEELPDLLGFPIVLKIPDGSFSRGIVKVETTAQLKYACQYFMSRGHWQIYNHGANATQKSGGFKTLPVRSAPADIVKLALKATAPIGDGLYGVDLKQTGNRNVVIEVNDNPSIDAGVEDAYLGEDLYRRIMSEFLRRMEKKRLGIKD